MDTKQQIKELSALINLYRDQPENLEAKIWKWFKAQELGIQKQTEREMVERIKVEIKVHSRYFMTKENGREYCSLCVEDDYCVHKIKIEALNEFLNSLT